MTNGSDRLDRIERLLEETAARQHEMAARQQYHDEAFERQDTAIRELRVAIQMDAENIRALAEAHERRLDDLDGR